jgi:hypothetical protein
LNRNSLIIQTKGKEDTVICFKIISNYYIRCIRPSGHSTNTWMWYVNILHNYSLVNCLQLNWGYHYYCDWWINVYDKLYMRVCVCVLNPIVIQMIDEIIGNCSLIHLTAYEWHFNYKPEHFRCKKRFYCDHGDEIGYTIFDIMVIVIMFTSPILSNTLRTKLYNE